MISASDIRAALKFASELTEQEYHPLPDAHMIDEDSH
jgi:hypothetical protein